MNAFAPNLEFSKIDDYARNGKLLRKESSWLVMVQVAKCWLSCRIRPRVARVMVGSPGGFICAVRMVTVIAAALVMMLCSDAQVLESEAIVVWVADL